MAETAVSHAIQTLTDLLIMRAIKEIVFYKKIPKQIEKLKKLLIAMQIYLKSADERQDDDQNISHWVSEVRDAAYKSEDVIEEFIVKIESLNNKESFCERITCFPIRVWCLYRVGKDIESILEEMDDYKKTLQTFGLDPNPREGTSTGGEDLRRSRRAKSSPLFREEDKYLVGLEEKTNLLVTQLLGEEPRDSSRRVISIVGMAGVGKTTLAREVYNHIAVSGKFEYRAWAFVSQKWNVQEMLREIIKQVLTKKKKKKRKKEIIKQVSKREELLENLDRMQEEELVRTLEEKLRDKCYLVVLDDIWEEAAWDCLAAAFPDVNNGSRLVMTSRSEKVPKHAEALINKLETLGAEDSWQLFLKKALNPKSSLPPHLVDVGTEILERCDGLPLAISVIGRVLRTKRQLESEWQCVLSLIISHLSSGKESVSAILALSYNDLPPELKTCFMSFAKFPEDFAIPTRRLFHLWVAEGLIQQEGAEVLEDVAAHRLDELIYRNLVQEVAVKANGMVKSCRVHDLLRDLAFAKAKEVMFLKIFGESSSSLPSSKCRHLVVHPCSERLDDPGESRDSYHSLCCLNPGESRDSYRSLRSLIFFNIAEVEDELILSFVRFKLLRVLDLENMKISYLPEEIGEVSLLRYLSLRDTRIKRLPPSLGCLQHLQTLDIYTIHLEEVPDVLWELKNLQHLYIYGTNRVPLKFDTLKHLQTLRNVHIDALIGNKLMELTSMRKLKVCMEESSRIDELFSSIAKLEKLASLVLTCLGPDKLPSLIDLSRLNYVKRLKLCGRLTELPHNFPLRLSHLSLVRTELAEDPMPTLEKLEHLSILKLKDCYSGKELVISENQLQNLTILQLEDLPNLKEIKIGRGAMPQLRCLQITNCYFLEMLPGELKFMKALEKLEVVDMPIGFITRLQGIDLYKVSHVSNIITTDILEPEMVQQRLEKRRAVKAALEKIHRLARLPIFDRIEKVLEGGRNPVLPKQL